MNSHEDFTLSITRVLDAPRANVWRCWTEEDLFRQWFCPKPWAVQHADFNLRPGGRMNNVMVGPDGERVENFGCFLEVVPNERLIFTDAFTEGFIPVAESFMTGFVELADTAPGQTHMVWGARHATEETRQQHLQMGFEVGWNAAADQLNELAQAAHAGRRAAS